MKRKIITLFLLLATAAGVATAQDGHRYGIKSGIVTMKSEMGETTVYFDNYGALEAQKMKMNFMGMNTEMTIIRKDGKTDMVKTILGRECTKYTMESSQMGMTMKQTVWVWKGIALKTLSDGGQFQFGNEATKIEENASIPASTFDVPKF